MTSSSMNMKLQAAIQSVNTNMQLHQIAYNNLVQSMKKLNNVNDSLLKKQHKLDSQQKNNRKPSGFALPVTLSDTMCDFLQIPHNSQLPRTQVTKHIYAYIKNNNLLLSTNKKHIQPDAALNSILSDQYDRSAPLTHFSLQKYINHHFIKSASA